MSRFIVGMNESQKFLMRKIRTKSIVFFKYFTFQLFTTAVYKRNKKKKHLRRVIVIGFQHLKRNIRIVWNFWSVDL